MYLCVKNIGCAYLYDFASTKQGAVMYMCAQEIEFV